MSRKFITLTVTEFETVIDELRNVRHNLDRNKPKVAKDILKDALEALTDVAQECGHKVSYP